MVLVLDEMRIWRPKWEPKTILLFSKPFLGVSQSDFIFQKLFLRTKTQKRNLKLNWQPLLWLRASSTT